MLTTSNIELPSEAVTCVDSAKRAAHFAIADTSHFRHPIRPNGQE
jgi:hypothetical protein